MWGTLNFTTRKMPTAPYNPRRPYSSSATPPRVTVGFTHAGVLSIFTNAIATYSERKLRNFAAVEIGVL